LDRKWISEISLIPSLVVEVEWEAEEEVVVAEAGLVALLPEMIFALTWSLTLRLLSLEERRRYGSAIWKPVQPVVAMVSNREAKLTHVTCVMERVLPCRSRVLP
jgi:hypothetical protein